MNLFYSILFSSLLKNILTGKIEPCLPAQECQYSGQTIKCSEHGICFYDLFKYVTEESENKNFIDCICDIGYITDEETKEDGTKCCYEQKAQKTALLLELLPLGFGHYYSGRLINFGIKMACEIILFLGIIIFGFCCQTISKKKKFGGYEILSNGPQNKNDYLFDNPKKNQISHQQLIANAIFLVSCVVLTLWQIIDVLLFGLNFYTDGNNVELKSW